jgi:hypothetical protein
VESQLTQNFWTNSEDYVRNRLIFGFVGISVISLFGCFVPAKLVPVSGPALAGTHLAVIKPSGAFKSGRFYADLEEDRGFSSGECKGRWSAPAPPKPLVANDMASVWDAVYGHVYYSQLLGAKRCARGSGTCKKRGMVLDVEICEIENGQGRKNKRVGVAKDDKGSVYKIECIPSFCNDADFPHSNEVSQ